MTFDRELTSWRVLAVAAGCGLAVSWLASATVHAVGGVLMAVPPSLLIVLVVAAVIVFVYSRAFRRKVVDREQVVNPTEGLVAVVLGKTMSIMGALLVGALLVYAPDLTRLDVPLPRRRAIMAGATLIASALFGVVGGLLERACLVPRDPDDRGDDDAD